MTDQIELRCPHCACRDRIDIAANVWVRVTEGGSDADESHDGTHHWTEDSAAYCCACGHAGFVDGFTLDDETQAARSARSNGE